MPVRPPPITIAGSRTCRFASESRLRRARELQRHQEVGRLAHAADQVVLDVDDRRLARARRDRDVVEAHRERLVGVDGAAEAHAAVDAEARPPRQVQVQRGQEVLVPAHGDAVLGDAAEAGQRAARRAASSARSSSRRRAAATRRAPIRSAGSGSTLRPSMPTTPKPAFSRCCASVKPAGPRPTTSTFLPMYGRATGRCAVERVPAGQQAVDLEAPAHPEHVGQHARLRLRDVDRLLLLEDARLHAVVADAVAGAGQHRVVDADHRQRADRLAVLAQDVHLADLLVQRAAARSSRPAGCASPRPYLSCMPVEHESFSRSWQ